MTTKEFKIWDKRNACAHPPRERETSPYVSFAPKGMVTISKPACDAMGLTKDSKVIFLEGADDNNVFFICKVKDQGMRVNPKKGASSFCTLSAPRLSEYVCKLCNRGKRFRVRMSTVPETLPKREGLPAAGFRLYVQEQMILPGIEV